MEHKTYLVLSENRRDFIDIMQNHRLTVDNCIMIFKNKGRHKLYDGLVRMRYPKYEVTYNYIKLIPDLWIWCYENKILCEYEKEYMITKNLYDVIRWNNYDRDLHNIVTKHHKGTMIVKYEMIRIFRLFRRMLLAGLAIKDCFSMLDFYYTEAEEGNVYDVDNVINSYLQVYKTLNPVRFETELKDLLNIKDAESEKKQAKKNKGKFTKRSKLVKDGQMFG